MVNSSATKQERVSNGKKTVSLANGLGKLDSNTQKNEPGPLSYTIHKKKLKMDEKLKCKQETIKILEEKTGNNV